MDKPFKNKVLNRKKALEYGFLRREGCLLLEKTILADLFSLTVSIDENGTISDRLVDRETGEEYVLYKTSAAGEFVGSVREAVNAELHKVEESCFEFKAFSEPQTNEIIALVNQRFGYAPAFLWGEDKELAVFKNEKTQKWLAIIMKVAKNKLGLPGEGEIEIMDFHVEEEKMEDLLRNPGFYPGWHMNKKSWATVVLDGSVENEKIMELLEDSQALSEGAKKSLRK